MKKAILFLFLVAVGSITYMIYAGYYTRTYGVTSPRALRLNAPINFIKGIFGKSAGVNLSIAPVGGIAPVPSVPTDPNAWTPANGFIS